MAKILPGVLTSSTPMDSTSCLARPSSTRRHPIEVSWVQIPPRICTYTVNHWGLVRVQIPPRNCTVHSTAGDLSVSRSPLATVQYTQPLGAVYSTVQYTQPLGACQRPNPPSHLYSTLNHWALVRVQMRPRNCTVQCQPLRTCQGIQHNGTGRHLNTTGQDVFSPLSQCFGSPFKSVATGGMCGWVGGGWGLGGYGRICELG